MHEAILYEPRNAGGRVQCNVCLWRCRIGEGLLGRCNARRNYQGKVVSLNYGHVTAAHVDPVEKKPLFHFYPGSKVFSLGSWGCNFRCVHCQNWEIAYGGAAPNGQWLVPGAAPMPANFLSPRDAVDAAVREGCAGICWTYNEPAIWIEYTLDCAKLAKERGLYTAYVSNGFLTPEALDALGPYLDAFRVDFKGFSDALYRRIAKVNRWHEMLDTFLRAKMKWQMHIEAVTNIIPTLNDDWQLDAIARWIEANLGAETPWHVTAFHPDAMLLDVPTTPLSSIVKARQLGLEHGLRFVYTGNVAGTGGEDTHCPRCGALAIRRSGFRATAVAVATGGKCSACGEKLNMRGM